MDDILTTKPLSVTIRSREKIIFTGDAPSLSSVNERGLFDILPGHENFISVVKEKVILHGSNKEFPFTTGILQVEENKVSVYIGLTK